MTLYSMNKKFYVFLILVLLQAACRQARSETEFFLIPSTNDNPALKDFSGTTRVQDNEKLKIHYLIEAVRHSSYTFIRNNKDYDGNKAAEHLLWKYRQAGKKIKTARGFIASAASNSLQTGEKYLFRGPDGKTHPLKDALENELTRLEETLKTSTP